MDLRPRLVLDRSGRPDPFASVLATAKAGAQVHQLHFAARRQQELVDNLRLLAGAFERESPTHVALQACVQDAEYVLAQIRSAQ
jgi:hypothetical protein